MKKLLLASAIAALAGTPALATEIKLGVLIGFTGPLESASPDMLAGAALAAKQVSDSGLLLDGATITIVTGDTGCIDAPLAVTNALRLITAEKVSGIVGGQCSGETGAALQNAAVPNGMVMISPSATSPGLSTVEDNGLFFRTSPSDARQGVVMADEIWDRGIRTVAVTYTNNDYGKGLADSFEAAFKAKGGQVTMNTAHEDGKADYSSEVAALASAGGEMLVVAGYVDQGGGGMVKASLDSGAFDLFYFPDGMVGDALATNYAALTEGSFGDIPGNETEGSALYIKMATEAGFSPTNAFSPESYDAAALILLAMQAAGSSDPQVYKSKILDVANGPGEQILPGQLDKALQILKDGGEIDYVGATAVELNEVGDPAGSYRIIEMKDGKMVTAGYR